MNAQVAQALAEYRSRLQPSEPAKRPARWRWWLAAGLTGLVMVGGLWTLARTEGHPGSTSSPASADDSRLVDMTESEPSDQPTATSLPEAVGAPLVVAPQTDWREWSTTALTTWLPASQTGPRDPASDRLAGFTRSPEGALMAAATVFPAIYYTRDDGDWQSLADHRVQWADGTREALWAALEPVWAQRIDGLVMRPVGFRMLSFTPDLSRVRLWWSTEYPGRETAVVGAIVTVRWDAGDWWLVFDEPASDMRPLSPARDSYLPWGPGSAP